MASYLLATSELFHDHIAATLFSICPPLPSWFTVAVLPYVYLLLERLKLEIASVSWIICIRLQRDYIENRVIVECRSLVGIYRGFKVARCSLARELIRWRLLRKPFLKYARKHRRYTFSFPAGCFREISKAEKSFSPATVLGGNKWCHATR